MIIGRRKEQQELLKAYESEYSEFVAVTGRRRVGKTFLVRETFNYKFAFQHSGLANQNTRAQLREFRQSLIRCGMKKCRIPIDWSDAFFLLSQLLDQQKKRKKVVFIDELPWMDAPRSNFVSAIEHFWNGYASARKDILLIICGSATSWIINNVFKDHGGLHNRVTYRINLSPFTLGECEQYTKKHNLGMTRYGIMECYMIMGGVPFYWSQLEHGKSVAQNIDALFFSQTGKLHDEYNELYKSLFKNYGPYIKVVEALGTKRMGMTRDELISESDMPNNGLLTRVLEDLEACGFIRKYKHKGIKHNTAIFQLIDNYTLFYYKFLKDKSNVDENYWSINTNTAVRNVWEGLAFEQLCFGHIRQIKQALGISGVSTQIYSWRVNDDPIYGDGAQIDMVIDRADHVVNLCEMKFSTTEYAIEKSDNENLRHKAGRFRETQKSHKAIHTTFIAPFGIKHNMYEHSVQNVITAEDLFKE
ncbi:MAG: ATP-binding protein [Prevotella sp.]|nr:ATP-binding protein [Prevotella sp.]